MGENQRKKAPATEGEGTLNSRNLLKDLRRSILTRETLFFLPKQIFLALNAHSEADKRYTAPQTGQICTVAALISGVSQQAQYRSFMRTPHFQRP